MSTVITILRISLTIITSFESSMTVVFLMKFK